MSAATSMLGLLSATTLICLISVVLLAHRNRHLQRALTAQTPAATPAPALTQAPSSAPRPATGAVIRPERRGPAASRPAALPEGRPDPRSLGALIRAWNTGANGAVYGEAEGMLIAGDAADAISYHAIVDALFSGPLEVVPGPRLRLAGETLPLADALFEAARRVADPAETLSLLSCAIRPGAASNRLDQIALPRTVARVLDAERADEVPLGELLMTLDVTPDVIALDLAALNRLEVIALSAPAAERPTPARPKLVAVPGGDEKRRRPTGRRVKLRASGAAAPPAPPAPDPALERLRARWGRERELVVAADHWTVLGLPRGATTAQIDATLERLRPRYRAPEGAPDDLQRLALEILQRVEDAGRSAREDIVVRSAGPIDRDREEAVFEQGREAFRRGDFVEAARCFERARAERVDSARSAAWLGWALFCDEAAPIQERAARALDELRLAGGAAEHARAPGGPRAAGPAGGGDREAPRPGQRRPRRRAPGRLRRDLRPARRQRPRGHPLRRPLRRGRGVPRGLR